MISFNTIEKIMGIGRPIRLLIYVLIFYIMLLCVSELNFIFEYNATYQSNVAQGSSKKEFDI